MKIQYVFGSYFVLGAINPQILALVLGISILAVLAIPNLRRKTILAITAQ